MQGHRTSGGLDRELAIAVAAAGLVAVIALALALPPVVSGVAVSFLLVAPVSLPVPNGGSERIRTADLYIPRTELKGGVSPSKGPSFRAPVARPSHFSRVPQASRIASELGFFWWR
jgi:hypothetical protein